MTILNLFINFINQIVTIKVFNFELIDYMIFFAIIIIIFKIINVLGGNRTKNKKEKQE
jgi:hypothetical protein